MPINRRVKGAVAPLGMISEQASGNQGYNELHEQFVHAIDVVPTILEAFGIMQLPIEGTSCDEEGVFDLVWPR